MADNKDLTTDEKLDLIKKDVNALVWLNVLTVSILVVLCIYVGRKSTF